MENAKKAVIQDASDINEGTYTVFDFINDFEAEAEQGKGFKLSLQRGVALPNMKLSGWLTVDGTPQKATVTIPKGTIIDGTGRVELAVFMEENSTTLPIKGDRFTCISLTDGQLRLSKNATLLIPNAWHKKTAYRSGNNAETIGSGMSAGYGRQKSGDADLLITTNRLGEIILYTAKAAPNPSDDPTPTPTPSASPAVSASPSADPVAVSSSPSAGRHDNGSNPVSAVVKVGLIVAVLALAGLAGCVYVLQKKGNVDFLSMFTGKNKQDRGRH